MPSCFSVFDAAYSSRSEKGTIFGGVFRLFCADDERERTFFDDTELHSTLSIQQGVIVSFLT